MNFVFGLLADFAVAHPTDGKLYIVGGGLQAFTVQALPVTLPLMSLVYRIEFDAAECGRPHTISVRLLRPNGTQIVPPVESSMTPNPNGIDLALPSIANYVLNIQGLELDVPGRWEFELLVNNRAIGSVSLRVVIARPQTESTPRNAIGFTPRR